MRTRWSIAALALIACGGAAAPVVIADVPPPFASSSAPIATEPASASASAPAPASAPASASAPARPVEPSPWNTLVLAEACPHPSAREKAPPDPPCGPNRLCGGVRRVGVRVRETSCRVGGALPSTVPIRIARSLQGRLRLCYESLLRDDPGRNGTASYVIDVRPDGVVEHAIPSSKTLDDAAFLGCTARGFLGLSFPDASGPTRLVLTLDFYEP